VQVPLRAAPRGQDLKEAGAQRPPASFKTSPLPRLDSLLGTLTRAGGGVRGGGGGRPRPFGMLPWRGRGAARRDHQPQLVYDLMTRDTSRGMKKPLARRREPFLSGTKAFSSRSWCHGGRTSPWVQQERSPVSSVQDTGLRADEKTPLSPAPLVRRRCPPGQWRPPPVEPRS